MQSLSKTSQLVIQHSNKIMVFASSSSIQGMKILGYRQQASVINSIMASSTKIYTTPFDKSMACSVIKQCNPQIITKLLHKQQKWLATIPGLMFSNLESLEDLEEKANEYIVDGWDSLYSGILNNWRIHLELKILVAVLQFTS